MANFTSIGEDGAMLELRYHNNFGYLPTGTVFMDYMPSLKGQKPIDLSAELKQAWFDRQPAEIKVALLKAAEMKAALTTASPLFATGTSYSGTSGSIPVLLPTVVDPQLYDRSRRDYPLATGAIPRVANQGLWADIIRRTALPTAAFKAEGAALTTATSTYNRAVTQIRLIYSTGEITGPMLAASVVWQNALTLEQEAHFRAVKDLEEDCIINGNPTAADVGGTTTDATAFTGLVQSITTNNQNKASTEITLDDIRNGFQTIRDARGEPDLIVTDHRTLNRIRGILQEVVRFIGPQETFNFNIGQAGMIFDGVPIIVSLLMPTAANGRELLILTVKKGSNIQMRVLQEPTMEELAKTSDSYKFMVKEYVTLLIAHENWCQRIRNLV